MTIGVIDITTTALTGVVVVGVGDAVGIATLAEAAEAAGLAEAAEANCITKDITNHGYRQISSVCPYLRVTFHENLNVLFGPTLLPH